MSAGSGKENFIVAHYDWIATAVGAVALVAAAAFYVIAIGDDPEELAATEAANVDAMGRRETGVKPVEMTDYTTATGMTRNPTKVAEVAEKSASFLASERRVKCKCGRVISGDVKAVPKCPYCGEKQAEEPVIVLDADGDGLPDAWEKKYALNPHDAADANEDTDKDGFTNAEEFAAKTDPTDPKDHPDYLDSLTVTLPLKQTYLPFAFTKANQIPGGWRLEFYDPNKKDHYGRGTTITAKIGEEIGDYGYVLKGYETKSEKRAIKGSTLMRPVDVSEAKIERKADKKELTLVIALSKKAIKPVPTDVQATLLYQRGTAKNFDVVPGSEIDLNGTTYKIVGVKAVGKGAEVTVAQEKTGKTKVIRALEQ